MLGMIKACTKLIKKWGKKMSADTAGSLGRGAAVVQSQLPPGSKHFFPHPGPFMHDLLRPHSSLVLSKISLYKR